MTDDGGRVVVDGRPIAFEAGDSVAVAMLRDGVSPGRGGTLCLAGDCGNCLATVDGIAYVRTCQTPARPGLAVVSQPADALPPLPVVRTTAATATPLGREVEVRRAVVDVAVIGGGVGRVSRRRRPRNGRGSRCSCSTPGQATRSSRSMPGR